MSARTGAAYGSRCATCGGRYRHEDSCRRPPVWAGERNHTAGIWDAVAAARRARGDLEGAARARAAARAIRRCNVLHSDGKARESARAFVLAGRS